MSWNDVLAGFYSRFVAGQIELSLRWLCLFKKPSIRHPDPPSPDGVLISPTSCDGGRVERAPLPPPATPIFGPPSRDTRLGLVMAAFDPRPCRRPCLGTTTYGVPDWSLNPGCLGLLYYSV